MEFVAFLFVMGLLALWVAAAVMGLVAFLRTRAQGSLVRRIRHLEGELERLQGSGSFESGPEEAHFAQPAPVVPAAPAAPAPQPETQPVAEPEAPVAAVPVKPRSEPKVATRPPKARKPRRKIEWERWVGVRGAAVLGGVFLAFAGLLLFQYSIEKGLITPPLRVAIGLVVGVSSLGGSTLLRRRSYEATSNALAGGGIVVLYASLWAAHALYGLFALKVSFVGMGAVTALCTWMAYKRPSRLVATLGLLGGFATPLLLSSSLDNPIGLFGYLVLLDLAFLFVGRQRGWPSLGLIGVIGTALIEIVWAPGHLTPERVTFALVALGTFAVLFAVFAGSDPSKRRRWLISQATAVLLPFVFAGYFAFHIDFGTRLLPIAALGGLLGIAASWLAHKQKAPMLALGGASGAVSLIFVWVFSQHMNVGRANELVGAVLGLTAVFVAFAEWRGTRYGAHAVAAAVAAGGLWIATIIAAVRHPGVELWRWLLAWVPFALVFARVAHRSKVQPLRLASALGGVASLFAFDIVHNGDRPDLFPSPSAYAGLVLLAGLAFCGLAWLARSEPARRWAWRSAGLFATLMILLAFGSPVLGEGVSLRLGLAVLLAACAAFSAARLGSAPWFTTTVVVTALCTSLWTLTQISDLARRDQLLVTFAWQFVTAAMLSLWPFAFRERFSSGRLRTLTWLVAALVALFWAKAMDELYIRHFDDAFRAGSALLLAAIPAVGAFIARPAWRRVREERSSLAKTTFVAYAAVAAALSSWAVAYQADLHALPLALSLFALGIALLWRSTDHVALKYISLASGLLATWMLMQLVTDSRAFERSDHLFWNQVSYSFLIPAAVLYLGSMIFGEKEVSRLRRVEGAVPLVSPLLGLATIVLVFVWISLSIFNAYSSGGFVEVSFQRLQSRDLMLSVAWAVYALILLGIGMNRKSTGLRWVSLSLLILTIAKVFLYDLGNLQGLYRVGSMFGLAVALLLVSFLYQRFVFRKPRAAGES